MSYTPNRLLFVCTFALFAISSCFTYADDFSFAIVSDPHVAVGKPEHNGRFAHTLERLQSLNPEFVIIPGDVLENWSEENAALYQRMTEDYPLPIHIIPGNHDVGQKRTPDGKGTITSETVKRWNKVFGQDRFAFEYEDCLFIGINNVLLASGLPEEKEQEAWFRGRLKEAVNARVFVFCHYPFFLRHPGETEGGYWTVETPARAKWLQMFSDHGILAVWNGHLHRFNDAEWKGIAFITTPATSFSCAADKGLTGFRIVRVTDDGWQHEFVDLRTKGAAPVFDLQPVGAGKEADDR
jgi:3',5'-cyclic AMP phosphodiesterase CpdA